MSHPYTRLGEAQKQIRLAAEELEALSEHDELDEEVVETLEDAAELVESAQAELADREGDPLMGA